MRYCKDKQINELVSSLVRSEWVFTKDRHGKLPVNRQWSSLYTGTMTLVAIKALKC
jgi:hypothetical protein